MNGIVIRISCMEGDVGLLMALMVDCDKVITMLDNSHVTFTSM